MILALAALVVLMALSVVGCGSSTTVTSGTVLGNAASSGMMSGTTVGAMMGSSTSSSMMGSQTTGSMMGGTRVIVKNLAFNPASVTVAVGSTVTWQNQDQTTHTVVADDGSFKSPDLGSGKTFSYTFRTAGTFTYVCGIHPTMKGIVVVR
jgi:plastocyanin